VTAIVKLEAQKRKEIEDADELGFKDDPTRIFRAARFAGRFNFELEWRTP